MCGCQIGGKSKAKEKAKEDWGKTEIGDNERVNNKKRRHERKAK
jgi:hypothetical protein